MRFLDYNRQSPGLIVCLSQGNINRFLDGVGRDFPVLVACRYGKKDRLLEDTKNNSVPFLAMETNLPIVDETTAADFVSQLLTETAGFLNTGEDETVATIDEQQVAV